MQPKLWDIKPPFWPLPDVPPQKRGIVVDCEFCQGEPTKITIKVYLENEVDHLLIEAGWSILGGKEMCPKCTERILKMALPEAK